jgi:butyryl-CoA dehydrogenase
LNDCLVPAENLLGEVGQGHHIAFNILNMGRFKLGAACVGSARTALQHTIEYATQRKAFGRSIAEFGLVQEKIAECATGIYAGEALTYRTIGTIDTAGIATPDVRKCIEAYAVECSIVKVWASEMLDGVVDHAVQIYGGYGYVESYPAAAAYRNARINRIFEGTNEINRLIIAGSVVRRSIAGQLPPQSHDEEFLGPLAAERGILAKAKSISLFVLDAACRKYRHELLNQQEIMGALADCVIEVYAVESCLLRAEKLLAAKGGHNAGNAMAMTRLYQVKAMQTIRAAATKVMAAVVEGDTLSAFFDYPPADTIALSRRIARHVIGAGRYRI